MFCDKVILGVLTPSLPQSASISWAIGIPVVVVMSKKESSLRLEVTEICTVSTNHR
jgi:hypothetical protein